MTRNGFEAGTLHAQSPPLSFHYVFLKISWVAANSSRLNMIFSQLFRVKTENGICIKNLRVMNLARVAEVIMLKSEWLNV